jgi:Ni/Fe-hydrogenase subunit HybB-like protein
MVYRFMRFWPILDALALYGHIINNLIIVYLALKYNISIFMCFNIFCVCYFYMMSTYRLNQRANKNAYRSGVQSQCDLKMAQLITKRFKNDSFYEFLNLRK